MIIVKVKDRNIDKALKQYKLKVNQSGQLKEYRNRTEYVKPSVTKRQRKQRAIYIQKLRDAEMD